MSHVGRLEEVGAEASATGVHGRGSTLTKVVEARPEAEASSPPTPAVLSAYNLSFVRGAAAVALNVMFPPRLVVLKMLGRGADGCDVSGRLLRR
jgi:hypothetical protein